MDNSKADTLDELANEADMYAQDATAFNCTQRAEHHKQVAAELREYAALLRQREGV